jgi:hypothetical protein
MSGTTLARGDLFGKTICPRTLAVRTLSAIERHASEMNTTLVMPDRRASARLSVRLTASSASSGAPDSIQISALLLLTKP